MVVFDLARAINSHVVAANIKVVGVMLVQFDHLLVKLELQIVSLKLIVRLFHVAFVRLGMETFISRS